MPTCRHTHMDTAPELSLFVYDMTSSCPGLCVALLGQQKVAGRAACYTANEYCARCGQVLGAMELLLSAFPAGAPGVLEAPLQRLLAALLAGSETGQVIAGMISPLKAFVVM